MKNIRAAISISGVFIGFIVVVAASIVFSIFSPFIFSKLVQTGDLDVLMISTGPLVYALTVLFTAAALGVFICAKIANRANIVNSILVILIYAAFSYWLSTAPSNQNQPYPQWFVFLSYVLLVPAAGVGHQAFLWIHKNE